MADNIAKSVLSVLATTSDRVKDLVIKDGQLIFCRDKGKIAFDFGGVRKFYNQMEELETDYERENLSSPINGQLYFVIEKAVLWRYQDDWIQLTTPPQEILFIGVELPELGVEKTLYVNKEEKNISIWDNTANDYMVVADETQSISEEEIASLFLMQNFIKGEI